MGDQDAVSISAYHMRQPFHDGIPKVTIYKAFLDDPLFPRQEFSHLLFREL